MFMQMPYGIGLLQELEVNLSKDERSPEKQLRVARASTRKGTIKLLSGNFILFQDKILHHD